MDDGTGATPTPEPPSAAEGRRAVLVGLGVIASIALAVLLGVYLVGGFDGSDTNTASAGQTTPPAAEQPTEQPTTAPPATTPPAPAGKANCAWQPAADNPAAKDVGEPPTVVPAAGTARMRLTTSAGVIEIEMDRAKAPCTVASFEYLASKRYFDGAGCHRLVTEGIFVLQCGDPHGDGRGGPTYTFADENLPVGVTSPYARGVVAMANAGPNTNGSQFFINFKESQLNPDYAVIGTVKVGMNVIDAVAAAGNDGANGPGDGRPKKPVTFTSVTVT